MKETNFNNHAKLHDQPRVSSVVLIPYIFCEIAVNLDDNLCMLEPFNTALR